MIDDRCSDERSLIEGVHFYREGPYLVFTERFLRERGYCCESACRHCPYGFRKDARADVPTERGDDHD